MTKIYKNGDKQVNEDAFVINHTNQIYAAIDGATGLGGMPGDIASQAIKEALNKIDTTVSLYERMQHANQHLLAQTLLFYQKKNASIKQLEQIPKYERSTSGVAAFQISDSGEYFDYIHAGDCMLFLQYENGDIRPITYDLIQYLDQAVVDEMVKLRAATEEETSVKLKDIREKVTPSLQANRNKLNTKDGYPIIDGSPDGIEQMEYGKVSLKRVCKILLLSDGLQLPVSHGEANAWYQSAQIAFDQGIEGLLKAVEVREESDPEAILYPRLKKKDDKTGILLEL